MDGVHDMGGMQCFGPVIEEENEPVFHYEWERRAFGLTLAMGTSGLWNIDRARAIREAMPPNLYLEWSYYQLWLEGLIALLADAGAIHADELESGIPDPTYRRKIRKLAQADVTPLFSRGWPSHRHVENAPRYAVGDTVTTTANFKLTHTRIPRYCRGKPCEVVAIRGAHVYPDTNALLDGENPVWLYTVRFEPKKLFGESATADFIYVDCFETYFD